MQVALSYFVFDEAADCKSVAFLFECIASNFKTKIIGVARQQLHFLCSDKENEAKESSGAALGINVRQFTFNFKC